MTIGMRTAVGDRPHRISLQNPGPNVPDGEGGSTQTWFDLTPPAVYAKIAPATQADLERVTAGTVLSTATQVVTMPYHPGVTTQTRIIFDGRLLYVKGVANPEERNIELILLCTEVVP